MGLHMTGQMGRAASAALMITLGCGQAQAAASDCWAAQTVSAAKVRDLQTMLMVAGLRCRASGTDVLGAYNHFVKANRAALVEVNDRLKLHFKAAYGPAQGQRSYDRFATALANTYGAGGGGTADCVDMAALAGEAASARGSAALAAIAERRGVDPDLRAYRCSVRIATR